MNPVEIQPSYSTTRSFRTRITSKDKPLLTRYFLNEQKRFACDKCHRSYKNKRHLYRHVQVECGKEPKFQCPYCPYKGKYRDHLNKHMAALHMDSVYAVQS